MAGEAGQANASIDIRLIDANAEFNPDKGPGDSRQSTSWPVSSSTKPDSAGHRQLQDANEAAASVLRAFRDAIEETTRKINSESQRLAGGDVGSDEWSARYRGAIDYADANERNFRTKLADKPQFDPTDMAMRRINSEDRSAKIDAEVNRLRAMDQKPADRFVKIMERFTIVITAAANALNMFTERAVRMASSEAENVIMKRDMILDRLERNKANTEALAKTAGASAAIVGAQAGGAAGSPGGPIGIAAGAAIGGTAAGLAAYGAVKAVGAALSAVDEKFLKIRDALSDTSQRYSPYSGPLAGAIAQREVASRRMDISEAALFGKDFAGFIKAQGDLDIEMRRGTQLAILNDIKENTEKTRKHTDDIRRANQKLLETMDAETRRKFEEAEKNRKDPLTEFLEGLTIPDDKRHETDKAIRQRRADRDDKLAAPMFGG